MVATGPFRSAVMPDIPGMKDFKGEMIHVKDYKQKSIFRGKRVLFVGNKLIIEKMPPSTQFGTTVYPGCAVEIVRAILRKYEKSSQHHEYFIFRKVGYKSMKFREIYPLGT